MSVKFGERLARLRQEAGLSHRDLAAEVNISLEGILRLTRPQAMALRLSQKRDLGQRSTLR